MPGRFWSFSYDSDDYSKITRNAIKNWSQIPVKLEEGDEKQFCKLEELNDEFPEDIDTMEVGGHHAALLIHRALNELLNQFAQVDTGEGDFRSAGDSLPELTDSGIDVSDTDSHDEVEAIRLNVDLDRAREIQAEIEES